jgi:hypothetical protein
MGHAEPSAVTPPRHCFGGGRAETHTARASIPPATGRGPRSPRLTGCRAAAGRTPSARTVRCGHRHRPPIGTRDRLQVGTGADRYAAAVARGRARSRRVERLETPASRAAAVAARRRRLAVPDGLIVITARPFVGDVDRAHGAEPSSRRVDSLCPKSDTGGGSGVVEGVAARSWSRPSAACSGGRAWTMLVGRSGRRSLWHRSRPAR